MQTTNLKLYTLGYAQAKTYFIAFAFVLGNILLPQLAHTVRKHSIAFLSAFSR